MTAEERWVDVDTVAAHLGVNKDSVYRWIESMGLPAHRLGRLFRFKLTEVDQWVRSGGMNSTKDKEDRENFED